MHIKQAIRKVLLSTLPAPLYWRLWSVRRGAIRDQVPERSAEDANPFQGALEGSGSYINRLLTEFPAPVKAWPRHFEHNPSFEAGDAEVYHALIRKYRPQIIIEVGVGYSSHIAMDALRTIGRGNLYLIDPDPRCPVPRSATLMHKRVQDVPISLFDRLAPNDVLFIDSSHTLEECAYHCSEILPRLRPGVLIQYHDIMTPFRARHKEEKCIVDHYLDHSADYKPLIGMAQAWDSGDLHGLIPEARLRRCRVPSSLWVLKLSPPERAT